MTAALKNEISSRAALRLWEQLKAHFINAERVIEEIIEKRAWEPLGYVSFAEAWNAQMADITLAVEIRPYVVYQLLTEGATDEQIAATVKGIGHDRAAALRRQQGNGVPPGAASLSTRDPSKSVVREHLRKKPAPANTIHVQVGVMKMRRYAKLAEKLGTTVEAIALQAVVARFEELG